MDSLQRRVNAWQNETFPHSTAVSTLRHFVKEARELFDPEVGVIADNYAEEAADCVMLLLAFAGKQGFDLIAEVEHKFAICQAREWQAPNADGVVEHVR